MKRAVPMLAAAWHAQGRVFRTESGAYYAIAKALVLKKYPPSITSGAVAPEDASDAYGPEWTYELAAARGDKARSLFYRHDDYFDERLWKRFLRRVSRFLMFVDRRRGAQLADSFEDGELMARLVVAEREMLRFGQYALDLDRAAKRRLPREVAPP